MNTLVKITGPDLASALRNALNAPSLERELQSRATQLRQKLEMERSENLEEFSSSVVQRGRLNHEIRLIHDEQDTDDELSGGAFL